MINGLSDPMMNIGYIAVIAETLMIIYDTS